VEPHSEYVAAFFATWVVAGVGGLLWLWRIENPSTKRLALRVFAIGTALLFALFVWLITRDPKQMMFVSVPLLVIIYMNFRLVKVCEVCASISRPQSFTMPVHCHKCGAILP
jgi:hypothetical protein